MKTTDIEMMDCSDCREHMADLLLDEGFAAEHEELSGHLASCVACATELAELKATFAALDSWTAPEPSPYFDTRVHALLREEQAAAPEGIWERVRAFFLFSTGRGLRPALTGALALVMVLGGGGVLLTMHEHAMRTTAASPTVNDLKILDVNAQAEQQVDQLLDAPIDDSTTQPTT
jgi:anti-sigma factor RsiW